MTNKCPKCLAEHKNTVTESNIQVDSIRRKVIRWCSVCDAKWIETYQLVEIEMIEDKE